MRNLVILLFLFLLIPTYGSGASANMIPLQKAHINYKDKASLQRGAKLYINFCLGCHSLTYLRYNRVGRDIGLTHADGSVDKSRLRNELFFNGAKVSDAILSALSKPDGEQWFGIVPPDLTLIARIRGANWLYTYLRSFYRDPKKTFGVNNLVFPDVAMPHVLESLQGIQLPVYAEKMAMINGQKTRIKVIDHLTLKKKGSMDQKEFDRAVNDLVNFLVYASAPERAEREFIGIWVMLFLVIFAVVAYLLKKEYWRDVE